MSIFGRFGRDLHHSEDGFSVQIQNIIRSSGSESGSDINVSSFKYMILLFRGASLGFQVILKT